MEKVVLYRRDEHRAHIVLHRPEKRNALTPAMVEQLHGALDRAVEDDRVRSLVLTGSGPVFCAGADLEPGRRLADPPGDAHPFAELLKRLLHLPKPVVAAVNGAAYGGGLGLVAAADVVVAAETATFSFSEVRLGLAPAMISVVVLPRIGVHHARRLFLTGRRFSASEAENYGLVHRVVAASRLSSAVAEETADLAEGGPRALAATKALIHEIPRLEEDAAFAHASARLRELAGSEEGREGTGAFLEKRRPHWRPES